MDNRLNLDFTTYFQLQDELDCMIMNRCQPVDHLLERRIMALLTELGELSNEVPEMVKYWSQNQQRRDHFALEEFVDGLHFILSIGLLLEVSPLPRQPKPWITNHQTLDVQLWELYRSIFNLSQNPSKPNWYWMLDVYLGLGKQLQFSDADIDWTYQHKNAINRERQNNGY